MAIIISVVNNKGGVGKTVVTCNLADALGKKGKRVLVVDMDSQCNSTSLLMPKTATIRNSLYELFDSNDPDLSLSDFIYTTNYGNVLCLPNVSETASLEPKLILHAEQSFQILRNRLRNFDEQPLDFVIFDNPPNMGTFVVCSLYASDFVIVPIKAGSTFSVEGLLKAINVIDDIRAAGNPDLRFLRLLINYLDKRTAISKTITDHVAAVFRDNEAFKTMIPVNTAFERAESMGKTIFCCDPTSTGAQAFRNLSKELIEIFKDNGVAHGTSRQETT